MDHYPVLLRETLEFLGVTPEASYVDATCGLGGHTGAIAERLTTGRVWACDRDAESLELAKRNLAPSAAGRVTFLHTAFSGLRSALRAAGAGRVHGVLADLGVSRYQLTDPERGFSLSADGPVDMRADRSQDETAADLVNYRSEKELADLIYQYGEERRSRRIAGAIVRARPITSTRHLAKVIESAAPRTSRIHPATQTFMALRIAVNHEWEELDELLAAAPELLLPGGRLVVLTFMSLEDRKVKHAFQKLAREGRARLLNKHVVTPTDEEVRENPASRSAKLRALEMLGQDRFSRIGAEG